jgi:hypothetical protein
MSLLLDRFLSLLILLSLLAQESAWADGQRFNVKDYGAVGDGVADDTKAIQGAVNAAKAAGPGNTVFLPSGTFRINDAIQIDDSTGLTFIGQSKESTMFWIARSNGHLINARANTDLTVGNFSADVQKLPDTGLYDMADFQGTITKIDMQAKQITVQRETGYPPLNRPDFVHAAENAYGKPFYTLSDPTRKDYDGNASEIGSINASSDGNTAVITVKYFGTPYHVGEKWFVWGYVGAGALLDFGYGNAGTTTMQNINYYGGSLSWMGIIDNTTGTLNMDHLYCGPPPYQPDRAQTCNQGWAMNDRNRAAINITNSSFFGTWDDVFDIGCNETPAISQPAPNQLLVEDRDFRKGDAVEITDGTGDPTGTVYLKATITDTRKQGNKTTLTFDQEFALRHPGKDAFTDLTEGGPLTVKNCAFQNNFYRHVYFRSGISVDVENSTFEDNTPLIIGGWDNSEGPSEVCNVTIKGNTFLHSDGLLIDANGGNARAASGTNVTVTGNHFINCGRYGEMDSNPCRISNVTGIVVANNYFENDWGTNLTLRNDAKVTVANNTFVCPNQIRGTGFADNSVIFLSDVAGGLISGNVISGAGPYTQWFTGLGENVTDVSGLANGSLGIDNPLAFFFVLDQQVLAALPANALAQRASWKGDAGQLWLAQAAASAPGSFTLQSGLSGLYLGNAGSRIFLSNVFLEPDQAKDGNASPTQLWNDNYINEHDNYLANAFSLLALAAPAGSPATNVLQAPPGDSRDQGIRVGTPPRISATGRLGTITVRWLPCPFATSYTVGRSTTPGGPYTPIASDLTKGPFIDTNAPVGVPCYYTITAGGLPGGLNRSNEVCALRNGGYEFVDIAAACNLIGIEPNGWKYQGAGFDEQGGTLSPTSLGHYLPYPAGQFALLEPGRPDMISDAGQRLALPSGFYTSLVILGVYADPTPGAKGTFNFSIGYSDRSIDAISQQMTTWASPATQPGETDAMKISSMNLSDGSSKPVTGYLHAYTIPIDPTRGALWLDLPKTGKFRLLAINLAGANHSIMAVDQKILPGEYLISPNGSAYLTQTPTGKLALFSGTSPSDPNSTMLWCSPGKETTGDSCALLQSDGNLLTFSIPASQLKDDKAQTWNSATYNKAVTGIQVTDTPRVQILSGSTVVWQKP